MTKPLFSIITVCYNSEKTLERTIKSVLTQTCKDYEYIIVDGASKDGTLEIVKRYETLFEGRMKWKSEPDKGIYDAMNKGVLMSTGDIIGIVNSDDWLEECALQIVADSVSENDLDIMKPLLVTGWIDYHYEDNTHVVMKANRKRYEHYAKKLRMGINHPATFVSKATYNKIGLFDTNYKLFGDADFIVRCYRSSVEIFFVEKVLSNMSDGGASSSVTKKGFCDSMYRVDKFYPSNNFDRLVRKFEIFVFYLVAFVTPQSVGRKLREIKSR